MPTNRKRLKRQRRPQLDVEPFDLAMVTGAPLPATFTTLDEYRAEHPEQPGYFDEPALVDVWRDVHGTEPSEADIQSMLDRLPEIEAARAAGRVTDG